MNGQKFEHFFEFITSSGAQLRGEGGGGGLPCTVLKIVKKCPDFGKKGPNCVSTWVESSIQNVALRVSRGKASKFFPAGPFFFCL